MSADQVEDVSAEDGHQMVEDGGFLLDVREADEWDAGHAPEAIWIPMGDLQARVEELPATAASSPSAAPGHGRTRSPRALLGAGFDAVNLDGGMRAWAAEDYDVVASDGLPGVVI